MFRTITSAVGGPVPRKSPDAIDSDDAARRAQALMSSSGMFRGWSRSALGFECEKITGRSVESRISRALR
jgi:hypothetical protein